MCDICVADHVVRFTKPSPHSYTLKVIKNWSQGRPGTRLDNMT